VAVDLVTGPVAVDDLEVLIGTEVGVSSWHLVDQAQIDAFADVTGDHQFIHVDPVRAAGTPFGGAIAHGFLTLSLLSAFALEAQPKIRGAEMGINYGFDKVRFLVPVKAGARVRGRFVLAELSRPRAGEIDITWRSTIEIGGEKRPAIIADWLNRFYLSEKELQAC